MKRLIFLFLVLLLGGGAGFYWWRTHRTGESLELQLYGNVDLRQVSLAFNNSERIATVVAQEGDHVHTGQVLATVETGRLKPQVDQVAALADAQRAVVERMHNGSRPEEVAQDRANVESAKADAKNAHLQLQRVTHVSAGVVSQQDLDNAQYSVASADAKLAVNEKSLELALAGPRKEDIAQAEAQLRGDEAQLDYLRQQLADAQLKAPQNATVRSRLMEPGDMASPQKPVFTLAITDPKWVRTYVSETDLGKVHMGRPAEVGVDSFPNRRFEGWVGFISPVAEFTPKEVQTTELRTSLVYEVRIFVKDPGDDLHLGMPATVYLKLQDAPASGSALANGQPVALPVATPTGVGP